MCPNILLCLGLCKVRIFKVYTLIKLLEGFMKALKSVLFGLIVFGAVSLFTAKSFAHEGNEKGKLKTLSEAAMDLQKSNPDLAAALTKFVNEEKAEKEDKGKEKEEQEGAKEEEMKPGRLEHIKLLRDSAAALKKSHPKLSERLTKMANHSEKRMKEKEGKKDKEVAGEKSEHDKK